MLCRTLMLIAVLLAAATHGQTYRYVKFLTLDCGNMQLREVDWYAGGAAHPDPRPTSVTSNGMDIWGDNADWEIVRVYDGDEESHCWLGEKEPPYTHEVYLDLGSGNGIAPDSLRVVKSSWSQLNHFQCWASNDLVVWDLLLDATPASPGFYEQVFPLAVVPDVQPPTAPTDLVALGIGPEKCGLAWEASTDDRVVRLYHVYQDGSEIGTIEGSASFAVTGLSASTTYRFHVVAEDYATNLSPSSDTLTLTTPAQSPAPAAPAGLALDSVTHAMVTFSWTSSALADLNGYVVYLDGSPVGVTERTTFSIPGLRPSTSYSVTVAVKDLSGSLSPQSTALQVTTPAKPQGKMLFGTNFTGHNWGNADPFNLTWQAVSGDNPWNQQLLREIRPYVTLRSMQWDKINGSEISHWKERTPKSALEQDPIAYEWTMDICNRGNQNMWCCVPHLVVSRDTLERGTNNYIKKLAILIKTGVDMGLVDLDDARFSDMPTMTRKDFIIAGGTPVCEPLKPHLQLYIEYSNETWNFAPDYPQSRYAVDEGSALGLGGGDEYYEGRRYHAWAALRVFEEMEDVFGAGSPRLMRIDAYHVGSGTGLNDHMYIYDSPEHNPRGILPDAFCPAPYFGHSLDGAAASAVQDMYDAIVSVTSSVRSDRQRVDAYSASKGKAFRLISYEGGQHVTTNSDVINTNPAMYDIYTAYLDSMTNYFDEFSHFVHMSSYGSGGAWGVVSEIGQDIAEAHKYRAILDWLGVEQLPPVDVWAPTPPTNIQAGLGQAGEVIVSWDAGTDMHTTVVGYQLFINGDLFAFTEALQLTVGALNPGTTYDISLKSQDEHGNLSLMSDTVSVEPSSLTRFRPRVLPGAPYLTLQRARGALTLHNSTGVHRLALYTLTGRQVFESQDLQEHKTVFHLGPLSRGTWLARMTKENGMVVTVRLGM